MIPFHDYHFDGRIHYLMRQALSHDLAFYRHSILVASLAGRFAHYLGFSSRDTSLLQIAAALHDIGKLSISSRVLTKVGPLKDDERRLIFTHPNEGYRRLQATGISDCLILSVARDHHERLDGSGYPRGLVGTSISQEVRMIALCDVYAAITEVRSYGIQMGTDDALKRMAMKRTRLDLILLKQFTEMIRTTSVHPFAIVRPRNTIFNQFGGITTEPGSGAVDTFSEC